MVGSMKKKTVLLVGVLLLFLGIMPVHAAPVTVPSGLNPGDQYRLVFVTCGTTQAFSDDMRYYNDFVTDEASVVPELTALNTTWSAIASTPYWDVQSNTNTEVGPNGDEGYPIFNLQGELLATTNAEFWTPSTKINVGIAIDPYGRVLAPDYAWTGTDEIGHGAGPLGCGCGRSMYGVFGWEGTSWVAEGTWPQDATYHLYAMSGILLVSQPVPAPTSLVLFSSGIFGLLGLRRKCRKV